MMPQRYEVYGAQENSWEFPGIPLCTVNALTQKFSINMLVRFINHQRNCTKSNQTTIFNFLDFFPFKGEIF
jgi:hypothetical protein